MATKTLAESKRYRLRVLGSKHDYIRRYGVIDSTTGRRVNLPAGPMSESDAQYMADDLNGVNEYAYECPECGEGHDGMTTGTEYCRGCTE